MFDRPSADELFDEASEAHREWLRNARERDVAVEGAGLDALVAGVFLQREAVETIIFSDADYPGGRLTWETGPVPIFDPAQNQLETLGYSLETNPPCWIDRFELLTFVLDEYLENGGVLLNGVSRSDGVRFGEDGVELTLAVKETTLPLTLDDYVLSSPSATSDPVSVEADDPLEYEVKGTSRAPGGPVRSGLNVLPEAFRETEIPLESAHLLAGRKAAELVLDQLN